MVKLKTQYPYIDENGKEYVNLIKTYAEDEFSNKYYISKIGTDEKYSEAVDVVDTTLTKPKYFSYIPTDEVIEDEQRN